MEVKNYVFYTIMKDIDNNIFNKEGIAYGIQKGNAVDHETYFHAFLDIDPQLWAYQGLSLVNNWASCMEIMADAGNIMIVNAAPELDIKKTTFLIYLPDKPSLFQIEILEHIKEELKSKNIEVGQYGILKETFFKIRKDPDYNAHLFLEHYIFYHKTKLQKMIRKK